MSRVKMIFRIVMGKRSKCSEFEWQRNLSKIAILKAVQLLIYFTLKINTWFGTEVRAAILLLLLLFHLSSCEHGSTF